MGSSPASGISRETKTRGRADRERHVRRPLREAAHVPRVPVLAVRDERLHEVAGLGEPELLAGPDAVQHLDLEGVLRDARRGHLGRDLLDERDIMRPEAQPDRLAAAVEQEPHGQAEVAGIHPPPVAVGDRRRLVVGALDQADRRIERQQPFDVGGRAPEVGLQADAGLRLRSADLLVQVDRGLGVGAALHVDPQVRAGGSRVLGDADDVGEAGRRVEVQAQLGGLHRDLAADPGGHDPVGQLQVVGHDLVRLGQALEVLAEPGVHGADPGRLKGRGRLQRVVHRLARHEPPDGSLHEPQAGQVCLQPAVPGGPQEDPAHASSFVDSVGPHATRRRRLESAGP
jgi:hypothetical protein